MTSQISSIVADLRAAAHGMDITLSDRAERNLVSFLDVLLRWRQRMALVSQRDAATIIAKHVEDSLAVIPLVESGWQMADLGSGAGFPGLVVALVRSDVNAMLVEPRRRKANFLRAAIRATEITNASVAEVRAEKLARWADFPGPLDLVVTRAVWSPEEFFALAAPILRLGGEAVSMRGPRDTSAHTTFPGFSDTVIRGYRLRGGENRTLVSAVKCST